MKLKKILVALVFAITGWALCFATIGIGMAVTSTQTALWVHAAAAPWYLLRPAKA